MIRRLKYELNLVKPIYEIMNEEKEIFEKHWQTRLEASETNKEEDIQNVLGYTYQRLISLKRYIDAIKKSKKSTKSLSFYIEYVELLLSTHNGKFDSYPETYMYLYSELLLGAQRYLNIKKELGKHGSNSEEVRIQG